MSKQYEYKILNLSTLSEAHLNELGKDGWLTCSIEKDTQVNAATNYCLTLVREVERDPMQMLSGMLESLGMAKNG